MDTLFDLLQMRLLSLAALRPATWAAVKQLVKVVLLNQGEGFKRKPGQLAFVAKGLLKEYDASNRSIPTILNFIGWHGFFISNGFNSSHYLKAVMPTLVLEVQLADFYPIEHKELLNLYAQIEQCYWESLYYRFYLLEIKDMEKRIQQFKIRNEHLLPYLNLKDVSRYLNSNYDHLSRLYKNV